MKTKITALILTTIILLSMLVGCTIPSTDNSNPPSENNGENSGENGNGSANNKVECPHRDADDDYLCDICGNSFVDGEEPPITPSCSHRDKDDDYFCDYCKTIFSDGVDSSGNNNTTYCNHNYYTNEEYTDVIESTCTEGGSMTVNEYCSNCGEFVRSSVRELNPNGHMTTYGKKVGICFSCGDVDPGVTVDSSKPYTVIEEGGVTFVFMGEYPQSLKKSDVSIVSDAANEKGYYLGSDGCYYAKCVAQSRGGWDTLFQNGETVIVGQEYYFKVMPIRWRVFSNDGGKALLVCDSVLDVSAFQTEITYGENGYSYAKDTDNTPANAYYCSTLRSWLNDYFYNKAFNDTQKNVMLTTTLTVSEDVLNYSDKYLSCEDKIFVPSYDEGIGYNRNGYMIGSLRIVSDYLRVKGYGQSVARENFYILNSWLRDPVVGWASKGDKANYYYVDSVNRNQQMPVENSMGVVMAMYISFE